MSISAIELKFMLRLLASPDYRLPLGEIRLQTNTSPAERDRLCRQLQEKGWVGVSETIQQFSLAAPGRVVLKLDGAALPLTPDERSILVACQTQLMTPEQLPPTVPSADRLRLLGNLVDRGFLKIKKLQITDVWLTPEGIKYLRDDCQPQGHTPWLSGDLLNHYLQFLRSAFDPSQSDRYTLLKPDANQVIHTIQKLDRELNTDNYLPLFYLREQLQPPLQREELNQLLYELQRSDRLELVSIQEVSAYTSHQLKAGIPQATGGLLFFVSLV
ncbi:MAG: hypothetical protein ACOYME_04055 [Prochlorotrichaceae cyanobacterium]